MGGGRCRVLRFVVCSLQDNYAMARLKETILSQLALNTLFTVCVDYMEEELEEMDQREKTKSPPRVLPLRYKVSRRGKK